MRMVSFLTVGIAMLVAFSAQAPVASADPKDHKVVICHIPPGNPDNQHTIVVDYHAVPAHLAHGDFLGPCDGGGGPGPE